MHDADGVCLDVMHDGIGETQMPAGQCIDDPSLVMLTQAALEHEAKRFAEMAATPESESLIGLFEGSTALKKNRFGKPARKVMPAPRVVSDKTRHVDAGEEGQPRLVAWGCLVLPASPCPALACVRRLRPDA